MYKYEAILFISILVGLIAFTLCSFSVIYFFNQETNYRQDFIGNGALFSIKDNCLPRNWKKLQGSEGKWEGAKCQIGKGVALQVPKTTLDSKVSNCGLPQLLMRQYEHVIPILHTPLQEPQRKLLEKCQFLFGLAAGVIPFRKRFRIMRARMDWFCNWKPLASITFVWAFLHRVNVRIY